MAVFKFKPFDEMTVKDYETIGFKSGLEVHQQLLTQKKLFCRCPAGKYNHNYDAEILRHMRPTLSELGEYDGTALMEFKTKKDIIYRIHHDTVCTYEMDDTPPFEINDDALDIALEIGILLNSTLVDELHIARKQYLDGSIPTGFQRTAITSVNGWIPYKDRKINMIQMSIEEDSCREISDKGHQRVYLADRLGMPLIETVTYPEMKTPNEVAEVNDILRRLVRSTGKVRTGIGAGRQDVNVSVTGGTRIEIKGVPRIKMIPLLTYNEAMRQWNLLRLRDELNKRGINEKSFEASYQDVTNVLKKTKYQPLHDALSYGLKANCVILKGFKDLLKWQTQTDTYFSKEISDRVRVIACLTTLPNIIHSDSPSETLLSSEWQKVKKSVGATESDTIVLVWGDDIDVETGAKEIIIRAKEATIGIPSETRQAYQDGTNGFERILPGPERMYPDTDLPPKKIPDERKDKIRKQIPDYFWISESWYKKLNIPADVIKPLAISIYSGLFKKLVNDWKIDPVLASVSIIQIPKKLKRKGYNISVLTPEIMEKVFYFYKENNIPKDAIKYLFEKIVQKGTFSKSMLPKLPDKSKVRDIVGKTIKKAEKIKLNDPDNMNSVLMGIAMKELRGKVNGKEVFGMISPNKKGRK